MEYKANGYGSDNMHPRFIAFLLRLGDLLDVDDKRFSIFNEKVFADNLPYTSQLHQEKHASVKHLLITPENIEITVDCQSDEVYRIARDWFDWLQVEVENQGKEWTNIAPKELTGISPVISRGNIKILYKSIEPKKELMNLRFEISNKKVFEMFEGSAIYDKIGVVFLREIVQNALDASKLQLWKLITSGVFDLSIKKHLGLNGKISNSELIKLVKFPSDLPNELWCNFIIYLTIFRKENNIHFEIRDYGTGISEIDLIRMTRRVGESRSLNEEYQKMKKDMPYWLKPTGAFGIGLQSLFIINKSFIIQTKADNETSKEITFFSAKNGEYSRISNSGFEMSRGTRLIIEVPEEKLSEMFENSFPMDIVNNYDYFSDKYGYIYMHKLVAHVKSEFKYIDTLSVTIFDENIKRASIIDRIDEEEKFIKYKDEKKSINLYEKSTYHRKVNIFDVYEDDGVGGQYIMWFYPNFGEDMMSRHRGGTHYNQYLVRDIPVGDKGIGYYTFEYLRIIWNFQSQDTDKILNISRDKFIDSTKERITKKFVFDIFPNIVSTMLEMYENNIIEADESNSIQYFHLKLTASMNKVNISSTPSIFKDFLLPINLVADKDINQMTIEKFFHSKRILVLNLNNRPYGETGDNFIIEKFREFNQENFLNFDMIVWSYNYLYPYIRLTHYYKVEYLQYDFNDISITVDIYEKETEIKSIILNEKSRLSVFASLIDHMDRRSKSRSILPPINEYWRDLSVNKEFRNFYPDDKGFSHFIISTFNNDKYSIDAIKGLLNTKAKNENLESLLVTDFINKLVPDKLVEFIIKNNPIAHYKRTEVLPKSVPLKD